MVRCAEGIRPLQDPLQPLEAPERQRGVSPVMMGLVAEQAEHSTIMIDATYLKAHRRALSLRVKKGGVSARSDALRAA